MLFTYENANKLYKIFERYLSTSRYILKWKLFSDLRIAFSGVKRNHLVQSAMPDSQKMKTKTSWWSK